MWTEFVFFSSNSRCLFVVSFMFSHLYRMTKRIKHITFLVIIVFFTWFQCIFRFTNSESDALLYIIFSCSSNYFHSNQSVFSTYNYFCLNLNHSFKSSFVNFDFQFHFVVVAVNHIKKSFFLYVFYLKLACYGNSNKSKSSFFLANRIYQTINMWKYHKSFVFHYGIDWELDTNNYYNCP